MEATINSPAIAEAPDSLDRPPTTTVGVLRQANTLITGEKAEEAKTVLCRFLDERDDPAVWARLAWVYRLLGEPLATRAILRNVVMKLNHPHIMDIIAARIPQTKVIVLDSAKVLYVNIPKCGSSSLKDAVLLANQRDPRGGTSHYHVKEFERVIPFSALNGEYGDYTKFTVTRHPRDRLRSYYTKNVSQSRSLMKEVGGRSSFYGLDTLPSYDTVLQNFDRYRNAFDDFRHHTDTTTGYLGMDKSRFSHIFDISEMPSAIELLQTLTKTEIPAIHNMRSSEDETLFKSFDVELESEIITSHYRKELEIYFS
jgi:hypothetical protein